MSAKTVFSQQEILQKLRPLLESEGAIYHKKRNILAKRAKGGERVETVTGDGVETINEAGSGDYIVQNQTEAGEQYVVPENEFLKKYAPVGKPTRQGFAEYRSTGKIVALELTAEKLKALGLPREFKFKTDWGEDMVAKAGDFMGGPADFSEVYRLARKEFFETYAL
ncbi:MAG: hypothetical protein EPGJADBJ_00699 [Saprospiraceae bacterium]|nr:hypothetical protein [Saprospiraceae bacterium]